MKKNLQIYLVLTLLISFTNISNSKAECTWHRVLFDSYEYTTQIPDLIPGTTVHNTPQSWAVHSGNTSMYMNFSNTLPAGSLVYQRTVPVCPDMPVRISAYLTTSFSGVQCEARIEITDGNNVTLANTSSIVASYFPAWSYYQSVEVSPTTAVVIIKLYTQVAGSQGGNDMSFDDLLVEQCNPLNIGNDTTICNTASLVIDAGSGYNSYWWDDNSTNQTRTVSTIVPGVTTQSYSVTVHDTNTCIYYDTIQVTYTVCSGIEDISGDKILLYPNPASLFFNIDSKKSIAGVCIFDNQGRLVRKYNQEIIYDLVGLASGSYQVIVEAANGERLVHKLMIE